MSRHSPSPYGRTAVAVVDAAGVMSIYDEPKQYVLKPGGPSRTDAHIFEKFVATNRCIYEDGFACDFYFSAENVLCVMCKYDAADG